MTASSEAIVERCIPYGDHDLVVHLLCRTLGRRSVLVRRGRSGKSTYRGRIEPLAQLTVGLREGRGELWHLTDAHAVVARAGLRGSYRAQEYASVAVDLAWRISVGGTSDEATYHLTHHLLDELDGCARDDRIDDADALIAAFGLKLLLAAGIAPQLTSCVRCGERNQLEGWSGGDGGAVCLSCMTAADRRSDHVSLALAVHAIEHPLREAAREGNPAEWRATWATIVLSMLAEHAGLRPARLPEHARARPSS